MNTILIFCDVTDCEYNKHDKEYNEAFCNSEFVDIDKDGICENAKKGAG